MCYDIMLVIIGAELGVMRTNICSTNIAQEKTGLLDFRCNQTYLNFTIKPLVSLNDSKNCDVDVARHCCRIELVANHRLAPISKVVRQPWRSNACKHHLFMRLHTTPTQSTCLLMEKKWTPK